MDTNKLGESMIVVASLYLNRPVKVGAVELQGAGWVVGFIDPATSTPVSDLAGEGATFDAALLDLAMDLRTAIEEEALAMVDADRQAQAGAGEKDLTLN